ncbi:MAG: hypothetical protein JWO10_2224, partial [Microbacteriaceae bacterium]|nr:hypothetical protein [Microbacteriaceae bacterium]
MSTSGGGWLRRQVSRLFKRPGSASVIAGEQVAALDVLRMLEAFGLAMVETGQATNDVEETLRS